MRRRMNKLAVGLGAASLVLLVAIVTLWVRSYRSGDFVPRRVSQTEGSWQVQSIYGRVIVVRYRVVSTGREQMPGMYTRDIAMYSHNAGWLMERPGIRNGLGFGHASRVSSESSSGEILAGCWIDAVAVPHWFLALVAAGLSMPGIVVVLKNRRAAYRVKNGRCAACGYDLRGKPAGGQCSECGEQVQQLQVEDAATAGG
jgi:hypothetical protein